MIPICAWSTAVPGLASANRMLRVARLAAWTTHADARLLQRYFRQTEIAYCLRARHALERLAARFAAKSACLELLGYQHHHPAAYRDVEICRPTDPGPPFFQLHATVAQRRDTLALTDLLLSMSHADGYAYALVVSAT